MSDLSLSAPEVKDAKKSLMSAIYNQTKMLVIEIAHQRHGHAAATDYEVDAFLDYINTVGTDGTVKFVEAVGEDTQMFNPDNIFMLANKIGLNGIFAEDAPGDDEINDQIVRYVDQWPLDLARWYDHVDRFFHEE